MQLMKKMAPMRYEAHRLPIFPYTRNPCSVWGVLVDRFSPVSLDAYTVNHASDKRFAGDRTPVKLHKKERGNIEIESDIKGGKRKYSTFVARSVSHRYFSSFANSRLSGSVTLKSSLVQYFTNEGEGARKFVGHFLLISSAMVFGLVILGGLTRLTESGLSMVNWNLLHFTPPKNEDEWQEYFEKYKEFPEYKLINQNMTLQQFKFIYYMEFFHRVYGRILGGFFAGVSIPIILSKSLASPGTKKVLGLINLMILSQGLLGWYMVKSGLDKRIVENNEWPRVSPYRLAAHLSSAFIIYLTMLIKGMSVLRKPIVFETGVETIKRLRSFKMSNHVLSGCILITAITGAFVAGNDAGLVYNSFPKMGDFWVPPEVLYLEPKWKNIFENSATVQLIHRWLAISTGSGILAVWYKSRKVPLPNRVRFAMNLLGGATIAQITLGITTLLMFVPVSIASLHQAGSLVLLTSSSYLVHLLKNIPK
ncbi:COX15-CtaA-domain-containing protein [Rozella allomycis CSF55]|uniref:COX15-CtaA-domain-containing protein n=1 Tax=Rozella allomycis (strain CSF55) TaxID=988480 RepID=A0A4P9YQN7_ROZAC|nr:COX15-CtaA-domain-containing protein [Rozella allomycis CSF55]